MEDVLVGLLDQLLKQPQCHDADLGGQEGRNEAKSKYLPRDKKGGSGFLNLICVREIFNDDEQLINKINVLSANYSL